MYDAFASAGRTHGHSRPGWIAGGWVFRMICAWLLIAADIQVDVLPHHWPVMPLLCCALLALIGRRASMPSSATTPCLRKDVFVKSCCSRSAAASVCDEQMGGHA
eukprot:2510816-Amphidinium_carterae.1